ncbi:MAG: hypothetical protein M1815_004675 [Lichina confinis]|nr:MAG: hypothetical protein M1815_004675 [Lichina confinis]
MSTLSYGLNITRKAEPAKTVPAKRKTIFDDDEDEGDDQTESRETAPDQIILGDEDTAEPPKPKSVTQPQHGLASKGKRQPVSIYGDLSSSRASKAHLKEAETVDSSIYDYDAAYDSLHAASQKKKAAQAAEAAERKPRYMSNLLAAAEVRKRDQLRARDKLLAREREAEGDDYADKEKFVTEAYKAQQEEVRRLEEEERQREEEDERRRKGKGMAGFYRSVLERDEKRHEEVMATAAEAKERPDQGVDDPSEQRSEADFAKELKAKGRDIAINDEGQIVDKRQLLSAGLNVAPKPRGATVPQASSRPGHARPSGQSGLPSKAATQRAMRERQSRMVEEQLEQTAKQTAEDENEKKAALERAAKSRKTESDVSSARERYLQRKREAALQAKHDA